MAGTRVTLDLDPQALSLLLGQDGALGRGLANAGNWLTNQAKLNLRVSQVGSRSGDLVQSIRWEIEETAAGLVRLIVGSDIDYALYHHEGTGIYGPEKKPITPTTARVLAWKPRGKSKFVFAASVKGVKPEPFLTDALNSLPASVLRF